MSGITVIVKDNNIDKALKIFKRKIKESKILIQVKEGQYFEKPSIIKRNKRLKTLARNTYVLKHNTE